LIEENPCDTKDQLLARERHYIDTLNCVNKYKAGSFNELGKIEYYKQPHILEQNKQYYINNIEKIHDLKNQKFKCECCGGRFTYANRSRHFKTPKHQNYLKNLL
jgi:hypothetical protein